MPDGVDLIKAQHIQIENVLERARNAEPEQMARAAHHRIEDLLRELLDRQD